MRAGRPRSDAIHPRSATPVTIGVLCHRISLAKDTVRSYAYTDERSPCSALFFDTQIWPLVEESPAARCFPARAHALEKRVALLFALFAG